MKRRGMSRTGKNEIILTCPCATRLHSVRLKFIADSGTGSNDLWFPNRGDTPHICIVQDTNGSADDIFCESWANTGKGKKTPLTELNISFRNFFRRKKVKFSSICETIFKKLKLKFSVAKKLKTYKQKLIKTRNTFKNSY